MSGNACGLQNSPDTGCETIQCSREVLPANEKDELQGQLIKVVNAINEIPDFEFEKYQLTMLQNQELGASLWAVRNKLEKVTKQLFKAWACA